MRWAEFPNDIPGDLSVSSEIISLEQLNDFLPPETERISAERRKLLLEERAASYRWRLDTMEVA